MPDIDADHSKPGDGNALRRAAPPNSHIMSILCNAMRSVVQCRMADPIQAHAIGEWAGKSTGCVPTVTPSLAAAIAARPPIWLIALAGSTGRPHLGPRILGIEPHYLGDVLGIDSVRSAA